ncbi:MAG: AMP-binding protein [Myxococcales bacterium]|jgi:long-subunit acyl-CoA synthetase (AMP-forming)|nr:AMP-binding protein [Myxococcales bacterium]
MIPPSTPRRSRNKAAPLNQLDPSRRIDDPINEVVPQPELPAPVLPPALEAIRAAFDQEKDNRPALWRTLPNIGFAPLLWSEGQARAQKMAAALVSLGLKPGDRVILTASGDWPTALIAALTAGGEISVFESDPSVLLPIARALNARFILSDTLGVEALKAALGKARGAPRLASDESLLSRAPTEPDAPFVQPSSKAALFVASDSTKSKRAVTASCFSLAHQPLFDLCQRFLKLFALTRDDHVLSILSPSQPAMLSAGFFAPLMAGATLQLDPGAPLDSRQLTVFRPTVVIATRAQWQQLGERIEAQLDAGSTRGRWARDVALRRNEWEAADKPIPPSTKLKYRLGQRLAIAPLKRLFGLSRVRLAIVADAVQAPLDPSLAAAFAAIDLPLHALAGSPASFGLAFANVPASSERGSALGRPFPGLQARLDDQGALWIKGPTIAPEALEHGQDGWIRALDQAELDFTGFVHAR